MSKYKNVGLFLRKDTPKANETAKKVTALLNKHKIKNQILDEKSKTIKDIDLMIVLGGDGTYLRAMKLLKDKSTPVIGVNLGSLGFLTENRIEEMQEIIELAVKGKLVEHWRTLLKVEVPQKKFSTLALNDVVLERGNFTHLINVGIYCDDKLVTETKADGMIIASPTGSTAYNLAAGGPLMHPDVRSMVVTPVCAHSLTTRPIIFPDDRKIKLQVLGEGRTAILTIDGARTLELNDKEEISVQIDKTQQLCLRHPKYGFFHLLREKLKFGERN